MPDRQNQQPRDAGGHLDSLSRIEYRSVPRKNIIDDAEIDESVLGHPAVAPGDQSQHKNRDGDQKDRYPPLDGRRLPRAGGRDWSDRRSRYQPPEGGRARKGQHIELPSPGKRSSLFSTSICRGGQFAHFER